MDCMHWRPEQPFGLRGSAIEMIRMPPQASMQLRLAKAPNMLMRKAFDEAGASKRSSPPVESVKVTP